MPSTLHVDPGHQPIFRELGIDADAIFSHELIKPWRTLPDRENCTLDTTLRSGQHIRWHVKRYRGGDANAEVAGHRLLVSHQIPTADLVAWGETQDGRSFVIFNDLAGYEAGDKAIDAGLSFERILAQTAELAAKLHAAGLHHRDLYLCHFFINPATSDIRLIDTARVKALPRLFAKRWIVKDLAQFWYSTTAHDFTESKREAWLNHYAEARRLPVAEVPTLLAAIKRKVSWIARHDVKLRKAQPARNISIPQ